MVSYFQKSVVGKTFPAFPAHAQPAISRIWKETRDWEMIEVQIYFMFSNTNGARQWQWPANANDRSVYAVVFLFCQRHYKWYLLSDIEALLGFQHNLLQRIKPSKYDHITDFFHNR